MRDRQVLDVKNVLFGINSLLVSEEIRHRFAFLLSESAAGANDPPFVNCNRLKRHRRRDDEVAAIDGELVDEELIELLSGQSRELLHELAVDDVVFEQARQTLADVIGVELGHREWLLFCVDCPDLVLSHHSHGRLFLQHDVHGVHYELSRIIIQQHIVADSFDELVVREGLDAGGDVVAALRESIVYEIVNWVRADKLGNKLEERILRFLITFHCPVRFAIFVRDQLDHESKCDDYCEDEEMNNVLHAPRAYRVNTILGSFLRF